MAKSDRRLGFTLRELAVVLIVIVAGFALFAPMLSRSRGDHARNNCFNNLRQIALAIHNYEQSNKHYPPACFNLGTTSLPAHDWRPADASGGKATTGYSWVVAILPMLEENQLYKSIRDRSLRFTIKTGPFSPTVTSSLAEQHASCVRLPKLICPAWTGDGGTNYGARIDTGPACGLPPGYGAPEYANVDSNAPGIGKDSYRGQVAPTNYKPMIGTHVRNGVPILNGGMTIDAKGLTENDFKDGTSKTILFCETKESGYASWYDGTLNWLVANDPNKPPPGIASFQDSPPWVNASPALNQGYNPEVAGSVAYLKKSLTANSPLNDVWWGPSSEHEGAIIAHVYADGHTLGVTPDVDGQIYLNLTTRSGQEPIDCCDPIK